MTVDNTEELQRLLEAARVPERRAATVDERLTALEDRETVRDLIFRYGLLCDARRWDELLDLYTDDFERELAGTLREFARGKDRLRQLYERPELPRIDTADVAPPPVAVLTSQAVRHLITDPGIRLTADDEAVAVARYALVAERENDAGYLRGMHEGSYIFTFRKDTDGRWRFSRMVVFSSNARNPLFQQ